MDDTLQQIVEQVEPIEHKQAETNFANPSPTRHRFLVIAGTSNGLLSLDSKQHIEPLLNGWIRDYCQGHCPLVIA